ncbi:MAG: hypothetical protein LH614_08965 [Pyrinomonadaceae bacterium]|nr:hypothetical protein [Pyrinomonadaceae bacterium]
MSQNFQAGDFLIFQIESGYGLLRLLAIDATEGEIIWHLSAYHELFMDVESIDAALGDYQRLTISHPHLALTTRAFEATQVARMTNVPITGEDLSGLRDWRNDSARRVSDLSVRLLLGFR